MTVDAVAQPVNDSKASTETIKAAEGVQQHHEPRDVEATLFYSDASVSTPIPWYININEGADGTRAKSFEDKTFNATIHDIRGHEADTHINVTGFQALTWPSTIDPELILNGTDEQIQVNYYPEVEKILKSVTGASQIVFFDHTVRKRRPGQLDNDHNVRQPVQRVHVDQTPISAHARVTRHAKDVKWKRFQLINVWRPLANVVKDFPLAVADFRSVDVVNDLVPTTLIYPDPIPNGETYSIKYSPNHRWCYLSNQTPDEILLLKCYDSASRALTTVKVSAAQVDESQLQDVAGLTPHTAFFDAEGAKSGIMRQSIEVRALVFYD